MSTAGDHHVRPLGESDRWVLAGQQEEPDSSKRAAVDDSRSCAATVEDSPADLGHDHVPEEEVQDVEAGARRALAERHLRVDARKEEERHEHDRHQPEHSGVDANPRSRKICSRSSGSGVRSSQQRTRPSRSGRRRCTPTSGAAPSPDADCWSPSTVRRIAPVISTVPHRADHLRDGSDGARAAAVGRLGMEQRQDVGVHRRRPDLDGRVRWMGATHSRTAVAAADLPRPRFGSTRLLLGLMSIVFVPFFFFASIYSQSSARAPRAPAYILYFFLGYVIKVPAANPRPSWRTTGCRLRLRACAVRGYLCRPARTAHLSPLRPWPGA